MASDEVQFTRVAVLWLVLVLSWSMEWARVYNTSCNLSTRRIAEIRQN